MNSSEIANSGASKGYVSLFVDGLRKKRLLSKNVKKFKFTERSNYFVTAQWTDYGESQKSLFKTRLLTKRN